MSETTFKEAWGVLQKHAQTLRGASTVAADGQVTRPVDSRRTLPAAAIDNDATNLLAGVSPLGGAQLRAYRKLLP